MNTTDTPPRELILQACRALFAPGQVVELRVLEIPTGNNKRNATASGYFNDWERLATDALAYDSRQFGSPEGIYTTLNPVMDSCLARAANRTTMYPKYATMDKQIIRRHWLPIDFDSRNKPSGVSADDAEVKAACEVAEATAHWLEHECGWAPGLRAMSGNGMHLLYRVDLPNDDAENDSSAEKTLLRNCLAAIEEKFGTPTIKVDRSNVNASRIYTLYGTVKRKGDPLPDRPHRRSHLLPTNGVYPKFDEIMPVSRQRLEMLAGLASGRSSTTSTTRSRSSRGKNGAAAPVQQQAATGGCPTGIPLEPETGDYAVNLVEFLQAHAIKVRSVKDFDNGGRTYVLDHCLFNPDHTGSSSAVGRTPQGELYYRCQHDSCASKGWKDVVDKLGPAGTTVTLLTHDGAPIKVDVAAVSGGGQEKASSAPPATPKQNTVKPSRSRQSKSEDDDPWELAQEMLMQEFTDADSGQVILRRHREHFYLYDFQKRCYSLLEDDTIRVLVNRWLGGLVEKVTTTKIRDVVQSLGAMVTAPANIELPFRCFVDKDTKCVRADDKRHNWITMRNGILNLDGILSGRDIPSCLTAGTPDWFSTVALPFEFPIADEARQCPVWVNFLYQIFEGDQSRVDLLQEAFGLCFLPPMGYGKLEAFFVFNGFGRNGKSTVLDVLRTLLGEENTSSLTIEQISDNVMVYALYGKLANICADMNEMDRVQEGLLKAIVSGDSITADRKYKSSVQFRPTCRLFFSCNQLPRFVDTSQGIWRRIQLIPFEYIVPEAEVDPMLGVKLEQELPAIFYWAMEGMRRLQENGRFSESERCGKALQEYRRHCLPVLMFLQECVEAREGEGYGLTTNELWTKYREWCHACGLKKPKPIHMFSKDIMGFLPGIAPDVTWSTGDRDIEKTRVFKGIRFKSGAMFDALPGSGVSTPTDAQHWGR